MEIPTKEDFDHLLRKIEKLQDLITQNNIGVKPEHSDDLFADYIPKAEVRDKLASGSTLWKWEKKGKLTAYGIGGKRYYKRTDLQKLFKEVK